LPGGQDYIPYRYCSKTVRRNPRSVVAYSAEGAYRAVPMRYSLSGNSPDKLRHPRSEGTTSSTELIWTVTVFPFTIYINTAQLTFGAGQRVFLGRFGVLQLGVVEVLDAGLDLGGNFVMFGRHSRSSQRIEQLRDRDDCIPPATDTGESLSTTNVHSPGVSTTFSHLCAYAAILCGFTGWPKQVSHYRESCGYISHQF